MSRERIATERLEALAQNEHQAIRSRMTAELNAQGAELAGVAAELASERTSWARCCLTEDDLRREVDRCYLRQGRMAAEAQVWSTELQQTASDSTGK